MFNKIKEKTTSSKNAVKAKISAFMERCRKLAASIVGICAGILIVAACIAISIFSLTTFGPAMPIILLVIAAIVCTFMSGGILIPLALALAASRKTYTFLGGRCEEAFGGETSTVF